MPSKSCDRPKIAKSAVRPEVKLVRDQRKLRGLGYTFAEAMPPLVLFHSHSMLLPAFEDLSSELTAIKPWVLSHESAIDK